MSEFNPMTDALKANLQFPVIWGALVCRCNRVHLFNYIPSIKQTSFISGMKPEAIKKYCEEKGIEEEVLFKESIFVCDCGLGHNTNNPEKQEPPKPPIEPVVPKIKPVIIP